MCVAEDISVLINPDISDLKILQSVDIGDPKVDNEMLLIIDVSIFALEYTLSMLSNVEYDMQYSSLYGLVIMVLLISLIKPPLIEPSMILNVLPINDEFSNEGIDIILKYEDFISDDLMIGAYTLNGI